MHSFAMDTDTALLTVAQMGQADRLTVGNGISAMTMMKNAGQAVTAEILLRWSPRNVLVLCGPGNNGGDGFVTANLLDLAGWPVRLAMLGTPDQLSGAAAYHASLWKGPIEHVNCAVLDGAELVVDALFGAGLSRPLDAMVRSVLQAVADRKLIMIAIDVPSGLMGDTGENSGAVAATLTVTYFRKKPGHLLQPGRTLCGELVVAEIGTPPFVFDQIQPTYFENDPALWLATLPQHQANGNKYDRGHALLVGGYPTTGAARMAARAAARSGAGLTTIAVPEIALTIYAGALLSIMVSPITRRADLLALLEDHRYTALLIGPGAGITSSTRAEVVALLMTGRPIVLDADALTVFRDNPDELFSTIKGPCVMTPHEGEFVRVFPQVGDKLSMTLAAAKKSNSIIIHKGSDTVIAAPDGRAIVNSNAPPTLATAGSGDVLSGIVLGLLAQGMEAFAAASAAVWIHGEAARLFGPGLIAEDLPDMLPIIISQLQRPS